MGGLSSVFNFAAFADSLVFQAFQSSNLAGKGIVLILIVFSIAAWLVMLAKWADLKELRDCNRFAERRLDNTASVFDSALLNRSLKGPYAYLIREAMGAWNKFKIPEKTPEMLSARMGRVENALQRAVAKQTSAYEEKMVFLGSIISGAPFLGLLGTVWGVMDCFGAMGQEGASATLQALAPGVSGALLTTVSGLVVAIPSVFGYNFLLSASGVMTLNLENFASSLADRIELEAREAFSMSELYASGKAADNSADMFGANASASSAAKVADLKFDLTDEIDDND